MREVCAAVACVVTIQLACGLETIELRNGSGDPVLGEPIGPDAAAPALPPDPGVGVSPPNNVPPEDSGAPPVIPAEGGIGDGFENPPVPVEPGCKKVDFLFVIDNSLSMTFAQGNLRNSFEGFLQVIREEVEADDFHIMVVDTDAAEDDDGSGNAGGDACRDVLGAGRRSNGMTGDDCGLPENERFITLEQPNLVETFSCMATVGAFGDNDEQPIAAMLAANSEAENAPQGCNAGFGRRDAVLVITLITNDEDDVTAGEPPEWLQQVLQQKGGEQDAVVVLGLFGGGSLQDASTNLACRFSSLSESPRLQEFVDGLEHGAVASVCSDDYSPFFRQAVQNIDRACTEFIPPVIQ